MTTDGIWESQRVRDQHRMRALKGHGEEHQRRGGAWHPEAKDEPGGGPGGGQAQSGARWGDSWEGAIRFVGKEVSG